MELDHFMYPKAQKENADAVAWVVSDKNSKLIMYPFTFPEIGEDQVRVKIIYTSICQSDILTIRQNWGPCNYPACPGHEIIGEITKIGGNVKNRKIGEKVGVSPMRYSDGSCNQCKKGKNNLCDQRVFLYSDGYFGGYATHIQVSSQWAITLPQNLNLSTSAPLLCAGVTVFAPLKRYAKLGQTCAIIGIGGLGHLAIQYANKLGLIVTAFTTKVNTPEPYHQLGAKYVQHSTDLQELKKNQGQYDLVLNTLFVNDQQVYKSHMKLTTANGIYVCLGAPDSTTKLKIDTGYAVTNQIRIVGSVVGSINQVAETLRFSADYNVQSICQFFDFGEFDKALERAEKGNPKFRCVIKVSDWAKNNGFDK